jgi:hypothetical protein
MSYIALATTTLGSAAGSVTFSSIPNSVNGVALRDLVLIISGTSNTGTNIGWTPNGDSSNHSAVFASGNGSSPASGNIFGGQIGFLYTTQGDIELQVMDYAQTDKHKTILARANNAANQTWMLAGRWGSNAAITSFGLTAFGNSFATGTRLSLYGVA